MRNIGLLLLALPFATALSGCSGSYIYQKADTSQDQFAREAAFCQNYAMSQPPAFVAETTSDKVNNLINQKREKDMNACMVAKGYTVQFTR